MGADGLSIGSLIGAGVDTTGGLVTSLMNFGLQQDALSWQKQNQLDTWRREDNAVQRRVADLKAAGLSPVLAAGSAASTSGPMSIGAPRMEAPTIQDKMQKALDLIRAKQDIAQSAASTALAEANTRKTVADQVKTVQDTINASRDTERKTLENSILRDQYDWDKKRGVRPGTNSGTVKELMDAAGAVTGGKTPMDALNTKIPESNFPGGRPALGNQLGGAIMDLWGGKPATRWPWEKEPPPSQSRSKTR